MEAATGSSQHQLLNKKTQQWETLSKNSVQSLLNIFHS